MKTGQQQQQQQQQQRVWVVTHALGSFLGHNEPELFRCGLATGLADFEIER